MKKWKTISSSLAFDNKWFKVQKDVVELPDGKIIDDYFFWKAPKVSQVVPINSSGKVIMVRQYKHAIDQIMVEYPAGYLDENETFEDTAKRELLEETGYLADSLIEIGTISHNPTKSSGIVKIFLAKDIKRTGEQKLDDSEEIEVLEFSFEEVVKMITEGKIWATGTIASTFLAMKKLGYKI